MLRNHINWFIKSDLIIGVIARHLRNKKVNEIIIGHNLSPSPDEQEQRKEGQIRILKREEETTDAYIVVINDNL